jgi:hypothetical protein
MNSIADKIQVDKLLDEDTIIRMMNRIKAMNMSVKPVNESFKKEKTEKPKVMKYNDGVRCVSP